MDADDHEIRSYDRVSAEFADRILSILLPDRPDAVFHTYEDITEAGGPSSTALVRLAKARRGELVLTHPRQDLRKSLNRVLAEVEGLPDVEDRTEQIWEEVVQGTQIPEDQFIAMHAQDDVEPVYMERTDDWGVGLGSEVQALRDEVQRLREENARLLRVNDALVNAVNKLTTT